MFLIAAGTEQVVQQRLDVFPARGADLPDHAVTVAAILWTIPPLRDIGVGILASAGVIGVIAGLAAQTTLGNLFAGLQIAFTDAIRIDDKDIAAAIGRNPSVVSREITRHGGRRACRAHRADTGAGKVPQAPERSVP